ncbi:diguanylate cyclase [Dokdonella soli]|uniref:diguanylate cyclase n=1 Tax=Dokdonella soli TaxID=529810 RepID=A0ABN1ICD8_9GAMM
MDTLTLLLAAALASAIMTTTMYVLHRASPREASLLDWFWAGVFFLATNCVGVVATFYRVPFWVAPAIGNALYIAGHGALLAGVRRHLGRQPGWALLLVVSVLVFAAHWLTFVHASITYRLMLFYPIIMALNLGVVLLLWRAPANDMKPAYWPLALIELFFFAQLLLRALFIVFNAQTTLTFLGSQFMQTSGSLALLVFLSVATMGCALIVIRHQELALRRASRTDHLTGWLNRHALQDIAHREFNRRGRGNHSLAFVIFDIDHFKSINDTHGHAVGDTAIRHVTTLAAGTLRGYDARFRIGGEEFVVLITDADQERLIAMGERLREHIEGSALNTNGTSLSTTVSVGIALRGTTDRHWEDVLRRADEALYRSKKNGRNRVSYSHEDGESENGSADAVPMIA